MAMTLARATSASVGVFSGGSFSVVEIMGGSSFGESCISRDLLASFEGEPFFFCKRQKFERLRLLYHDEEDAMLFHEKFSESWAKCIDLPHWEGFPLRTRTSVRNRKNESWRNFGAASRS